MIKAELEKQYKQKLVQKNPNVVLIGDYVNAKTQSLHKCLLHDIEWMTTPTSVLRGAGCHFCKSERISKRLNKSHEQYVEEVANISPHIRVIGKYENANKCLSHYCTIHNTLWDALPSNILSGHGCYECGIKKQKTSKQKGHDQYADEVKKLHPNIIVTGEYVGNHKPIEHYCVIHDYYWKAQPSNILSGKGCRLCGNEKLSAERKMTEEQYKKLLSMSKTQIELIGTFISASQPTLHRCLVDGYEWMARPSKILYKNGCPLCAGSLKLTHSQYVERLADVNADIMPIEKYVNMATPITHACKIDGYQWKVAPYSTLSGKGCPQCSETSGERAVRKWLEKNGINYIFQKSFPDCRDKGLLFFDFYLPDYHSCIEYDGKQHYMPIKMYGGYNAFETLKYHDNLKDDYCNKNGIRLLRIPYYANVEAELNNFLFNTVIN